MRENQRYRRLKPVAGLAAAAALAACAAWFGCPPPLEEARRFPAGAVLRDRTGAVLRVGLGPGGTDCRPTYRASPEDWIVKAVIAAEDRRFQTHGGVDLVALARAAVQNVGAGRRVSGASTITMQTVRLIRPHPRTWRWKAVESVQALRLERAWSKAEILSQYLNRAPFGSNLVGVEAAAQGWFGKAPGQLNLAEAALLAGLLQSPTRLRPDRYPEAACRRRAVVLARMTRAGLIGLRACEEAGRQPLALRRAPRPFSEPFFCEWALQAAELGTGAHRTTLDPGLQEVAEQQVERASREACCDAAAVVLEVAGGAVRAMACSGDYFAGPSGQVNPAVSPRPAGSTLKPFAYALAADRGCLTPGRVLADVPRRFGEEEPLNFSGGFMGLVTAREALVLSLNLPAMGVVEEVGQPLFYGALRQLGFEALSRPAAHYGLGLVLGNGPVRLTELANAYACLARGGEWRPLARVERPEGGDGAPHRRVFSEGACWLVSEMLSGDERASESAGHRAEVALPRFAWKTGTSSGYRDAWTVAWNPEYVVAVWCGFKSGRRGPESLVGKQVAAPLAWEIIRQLYPDGGAPWYEKPDGVVAREVCAVSGRVPGPLCGRRVADWALCRRTSWGVCPVHVSGPGAQACERWPAEVQAFLARRAEGARAAAGQPGGLGLKVLAPSDGAVFRRLAGVEGQAVAFKLQGALPGAPHYWFRNERLVATTIGEAPYLWPLERGTHRFVCATPSGEASSVTIRVEE